MTWTTFDSNGKQQIAGSIADMPVGTIVDFAADNPPNGWLKCDGSTVSRTGFSDLFAVISTNYGSGDGSTTFTLPDITGAIIFATPLDKRIKVLTPPQYVSALPAAPIDGQEIYYQASAASGVIWHLRYNAASSSSYKWEYVGGPGLSYVDYSASSSISIGTTFTEFSPSVAITIPVPGTYLVWSDTSLYTNAGSTTWMGISVNSDNPGTGGTGTSFLFQTTTEYRAASAFRRVTVTTAGHIIKAMWRLDSGSTTLYRGGASLVAMPVRVGVG